MRIEQRRKDWDNNGTARYAQDDDYGDGRQHAHKNGRVENRVALRDLIRRQDEVIAEASYGYAITDLSE